MNLPIFSLFYLSSAFLSLVNGYRSSESDFFTFPPIFYFYLTKHVKGSSESDFLKLFHLSSAFLSLKTSRDIGQVNPIFSLFHLSSTFLSLNSSGDIGQANPIFSLFHLSSTLLSLNLSRDIRHTLDHAGTLDVLSIYALIECIFLKICF